MAEENLAKVAIIGGRKRIGRETKIEMTEIIERENTINTKSNILEKTLPLSQYPGSRY